MVKFKTGPEDEPIMGMGLSELNIRKLKEGMPILVDDPTFFKGKIVIMYGKTEQAIMEDLKKNFDFDKKIVNIRLDKDKQ